MKSFNWVYKAILGALLGVLIYRFIADRPIKETVLLTGQTMGTIAYSIQYRMEEPINFQSAVDSLLHSFNQVFSTYIPQSEISIFNNSDTLFRAGSSIDRLLTISREINVATEGAFDPTVGPLVNIWGFGPERFPVVPDSTTVDSIRQFVGLGLIQETSELITKPAGVYLDFSAIAKGQAVDWVGAFLESHGITDYLVEIGGEVRCRGMNKSEKPWSIGIEDPTVELDERNLFAAVSLFNLSVATSGNYRNYYHRDGRLVAHIVDPRTGYTADHELLSASVFTAECMIADAYATAFMVLGLEESKEIAAREGLEVFFIYMDEKEEIATYISDGLRDKIQL